MASRAETAAATNVPDPEKAARQGTAAAEDGEKKKLVEGKLPEDQVKLIPSHPIKLIPEEQLAAIRGDPVEREEDYFRALPLMARCAQLFHQSRPEGLVEVTDDRQM